MTTGEKGMFIYIAGIVVCMLLDAAVVFTGNAKTPTVQCLLMSMPLFWSVAVFIYCAIKDPMERFKNSNPMDRAGRMLMFDKGDDVHK